MTNLDWVKQMGAEEMAIFLYDAPGCCDFCTHRHEDVFGCFTSKERCMKGVEEWLKEERMESD